MNISNLTSTLPFITTSQLPSFTPLWIGYLALFITVILFGSNWAPIKKFETGDGIQLMQ